MPDSPDAGPKVTFESRDKYLYAHVSSAVIDSEVGRAYLTAIADEIDRTGATRVMLVRDISAEPSVGGTFHSMEWFLTRAGRVRLAWVNPYPHLNETLEFAMTVAVNRGARFRLFDNEAAAEAWLLA